MPRLQKSGASLGGFTVFDFILPEVQVEHQVLDALLLFTLGLLLILHGDGKLRIRREFNSPSLMAVVVRAENPHPMGIVL